MSKTYYAKVDNIIFQGKQYNKGAEIIVDNDVEMNEYRWETEAEYKKKQDKVAKSTAGLTESEKDKKIADLHAKLDEADKTTAEAEKRAKEAEAALKAANKECDALKAKIEEMKK